MAPIVHWMRDVLHARSSVYIPKETVLSNQQTRASTGYPFDMQVSPMEHFGDKSEPSTPEKSGDGSYASSSSKVSFVNRYQLWPKMKKRLEHRRQASDGIVLPIQDRSPSSLSDTNVPAPNLVPNYGGSLSRRRKISVPELRRRPAPETFESLLLDSREYIIPLPIYTVTQYQTATIPGRPPLRSVSSDLGQHERSSSCPALGVENSTESKPIPIQAPRPKAGWPVFSAMADWMAFNPTRPLSPIFSPIESNTPILATSPTDDFETKPQVPPKPDAVSLPSAILPPRKVFSIQGPERIISKFVTGIIKTQQANITSIASLSYFSIVACLLTEDVNNSQQ